MLPPPGRMLLVHAIGVLAPAAPALADPGTTGGVPAIEPPAISAQGGVPGPTSAEPPAAAAAAQAENNTPTTTTPTTTTPATTAPETPADKTPNTVDVPLAEPSSATEPTATTSPSSGGGGGLPHTGFALAALVAVGTGFFLTGYALRYS